MVGSQLGQQITFTQGKFKVVYGLILGELLGDSPEEKERLGENRFFAEVHLIQALPKPAFDDSNFEAVSSDPLITQYNAAKDTKNPIDQFLGYFKILEDLYGPTSKRVKLAKALKASGELQGLVRKHLHKTKGGGGAPLDQDDFLDLIDKIVRVRHECAHLRKNFGITHGHPRVSSDVEPLINPLRAITFEAVRLHL